MLVLVVHLCKFGENPSVNLRDILHYIQDFNLEHKVKVTKTKSTLQIILKVYLCWIGGKQAKGSRDISIVVKFSHI